jgi:hypothetical protein
MVCLQDLMNQLKKEKWELRPRGHTMAQTQQKAASEDSDRH